MTVAILEQAVDALVENSSTKLQSVADNLSILVRNGDTDLIAPLLIVAEAMPSAAERVGVYRFAAAYAPSGSALEQQAEAGLLKHAEALPDAEAYEFAVTYVPSGNALEQQAYEKPGMLQPTKSEKIAAFVQRFATPAPK